MTPPSSSFDHDVVIAGAGPGGCAVAMRLAAREPALAGRILVLDRARFPRDKPCGGGLTGHAREAMATLGFALTVPYAPAPNARVRFGGFARDVLLPRPVDVVRRDAFDASLVEQVRARGVEVREGAPLEGYDVDRDGVTLTAGGRRLRARVLVGADGAGSLIRKRLRPRAPTPIRLFRAFLPAPVGWPDGDRMIYDFTPMGQGMRGYLWVFPVPGGGLNVGVMHAPTTPLSGAELHRLLAGGLRRYGLSLPEAGTRGWPAWGYEPQAPVAADRVLVLGDAAGIDALTGEGIAVAMEQAVIAGDAIVAALASEDFRFAGYRRALRQATVGRELFLDGWLARLLYDRRLWREWLALVLFDPAVLELYAARVAGGLVLADHKRRLFAALARHLVRWPERRRALAEAERAADPERAG